MSRALIAVLVVTNLATASGLAYFYQAHSKATATTVTQRERATLGRDCIDWVNEWISDYTAQEYVVARGWRKHGQLVFEAYLQNDERKVRVDDRGFQLSDAEVPQMMLCTVDPVSGVMTIIKDDDMKAWMFY